MFGFGRKKKESSETADTFVEATGGGWGDSPEVVAADGGSQADFVGHVLKQARDYALKENIAVGESFTYKITDIPRGIVGPHDIVFGIMVRASEVGLRAGVVFDEEAQFTRIK